MSSYGLCGLQEKTCEESTSFDLTPYEVASAITAVDRLLLEQVKASSAAQAEDASDHHSGQHLLGTPGMAHNVT